MIECYRIECKHHDYNSCEDSGPFCCETKCCYETVSKIEKLVVPKGYTEEELDRDNPYNKWMYEMKENVE